MKAIRVIENCQSNHLSEEILLSNEPLLLKNFVHDWPLVKEAKKSDSAVISYLRNFDAKKPLTAMTGDPSIKGRIFYNEDLSGFNFDYRRVSLEEIFQKLTECSKLQEPPMIYVGSTNIYLYLIHNSEPTRPERRG